MKHPRRKEQREFPFAANSRFYEKLNDFLSPSSASGRAYRFQRGIPASRIRSKRWACRSWGSSCIVVNGKSVGFDYRLQDGDRVAVYPVFESFDVSPGREVAGKTAAEDRVRGGRQSGPAGAAAAGCWDSTRCFPTPTPTTRSRRFPKRRDAIVLTRDRRLLHAKAGDARLLGAVGLAAAAGGRVVRRFTWPV
jgi:hypothetical protein